ncbi:MAG TPA: phosphate ABC transporter permease subunit PstC [Gammaproteobacteria bacterium]|nr:phosphate ABC transporter permease subunit PstC [Gammaproteobacteria bacterium]
MALKPENYADYTSTLTDGVHRPAIDEKVARLFRKQNHLDKIIQLVAAFFAACLLVLAIAIVIKLFQASTPSIKAFRLHFLFNASWNPVTHDFGALVPILGTLITSFIALLIGIPISFGIALFLTELAPEILRQPLRILVELLAGIPSIIYGMWGLFIFAPWFADNVQPWLIEHLGSRPFLGPLFQGAPLGIGLLTAGIVLSIMVIPFIASVMRDVFEIVPDLLKESAYALGATRWEVVWNIILPYSRVGVVGGIILGLGRALGETMAVAFVIGNAHQLSSSLLMPSTSISSALANEFTEATGTLYNSALSELGLILFGITLLVFVMSKMLMKRLQNYRAV